ncbi:MAG: hypothetical protein E4H09_01080 [Spirochaetales bacterium]|nr:MAG: hypothetical protein E4H09_01080 [Spirochaetales bacterium]
MDMGDYRLLLLGPPRIEKDGMAVTIHLRKAIALAAYLAVERRELSRDHLAAMFWPNLGQNQAFGNLRRTLSILRTTLGNGCVITDGDQVRIDCEGVLVDVSEFHALSTPTSPDDLTRMERACELYRSSFLEGFNLSGCEEFADWQDAIRARLHAEYEAVLATLCAGHIAAEQPDKALPCALRWLALDQWNEAAHRTIMQIYALTSRPSLALKQYESCKRILNADGLEPDDLTRNLRDTIASGTVSDSHDETVSAGGLPEPASGNPTADRSGPRGRRRRVLVTGVAALLVAGATFVLVYAYVGTRPPIDLLVTNLDIVTSKEELLGMKFTLGNLGRRSPRSEYFVVITGGPSGVDPREYTVYSQTVRIHRREKRSVEVSVGTIREYLNHHAVPVPPGTYAVSVLVDAGELVDEEFSLNNRADGADQVYFSGAAGVELFEVTIAFGGEEPIDQGNPLLVFLGDRSQTVETEEWARFVVTEPGTYQFPLSYIPRKDSDGSGYHLIIVHDVNGDLHSLHSMDAGNRSSIYKEVPGNLVYGSFSPTAGTPVYPGMSYHVVFQPPPPPGPDEYENDDHDVLGTKLDYAELPIRQHHTFHDKGTGDKDEDWFRIFLRSGDSLIVETYTAGWLWEADTGIDIKNISRDYIGSNFDKTTSDKYSRLVYTNESGIDEEHHILAKPYSQFNIGKSDFGEYIVEFRQGP